MSNTKNKITTNGYFLRRLRESGFIALRIFKDYSISDPRRWTIMVDPANSSLFITCYENKNFKGEIMFEFNDGGNKFSKNYNLKTQSMEIIITNLIERGISQKEEGSIFEKKS
jgi:hypothetical protein